MLSKIFENSRTAELQSLNLLSMSEDSTFYDIAKTAAQIADRPMAMVTLVDENRQWFAAKHGIALKHSPRAWSLCASAMMEPQLLDIHDLHLSKIFNTTHFVRNSLFLRAYTGVPILSTRGLPMGALCACDTKPGGLNQNQIDKLQELAMEVMVRIEKRRDTFAKLSNLNRIHFATNTFTEISEKTIRACQNIPRLEKTKIEIQKDDEVKLVCSPSSVVKDLTALIERASSMGHGRVTLNGYGREGIFRIFVGNTGSANHSLTLDLRLAAS